MAGRVWIMDKSSSVREVFGEGDTEEKRNWNKELAIRRRRKKG